MLCILAFQHATRKDRSEGVRAWPGHELPENRGWTASLGILLALKPASHALASFASPSRASGLEFWEVLGAVRPSEDTL